MLNAFPDLLVFQTLAPTIIRVAVALAFLYVAYAQFGRRDEIAQLRFFIIGSGGWIAWAFIAFHTIVGAMLFFGYATQIAALLAAIGLIKGLWLNKHYPSIVILPRSTILLLIAMCLSLLLSGAGALAQDLQQL